MFNKLQHKSNRVDLTKAVKEFLADLEKVITTKDSARLHKKIEMLEMFGTGLGEPHASPVKGKLRELKVRVGKKWIRIFYFEAEHGEFVLVHAIAKKTNKLPPKEIELALIKMKEYETPVQTNFEK